MLSPAHLSTTQEGGPLPLEKINLKSWEALKHTLYLISGRKKCTKQATWLMLEGQNVKPWALTHSWRTPWFLLLQKTQVTNR